MIGASRPAPNAAERNVAFSSSRAGKPKLTLETPSAHFTPKRSLHMLTARRICSTWRWLVEAVMTRQSMRMRSGPIPQRAASPTMRRAMAKRASAVSGMPSSSSARPITSVP